uniref:Transposase (Putative), gypsy type n=1 Tax=Tanacetum cinerariifolium TaxID=118510 RepID=A0A6L2JAZ1_TANCI|nr:hypothetical protein [Tanacetum cinerariifolium]
MVVKRLRLNESRGLGLLLMRMWLLRSLSVHARKGKLFMDASGSHPPKKLTGDHKTSSEAATGVKYLSILKELLASSKLNVEVDSSHHSSTNASGAEGDSIIRSIVVPPAMTEAVVTSHAVNVLRFWKQVSAAEATEKMHAAKIDAMKQRNVALEKEKDSLDGKVTELQSLVFVKDLELNDLNVHALETTCFGLNDHVSGYERLKEQIEEFQDAQMNIVNDKVARLDADLLEMALHLEEKFDPHLLTIISGRSRAIKKGMQDGLSTGIDHEKAGRSLTDVVAYNMAVEVDYNSALQTLREVDFPLLDELKSHKDASTVDVMDLLRLEGPLVDAPGISDLKPDVEQLTLPIHRPEDQVVFGETSLSFALSVTHSRVERITKNVGA